MSKLKFLAILLPKIPARQSSLPHHHCHAPSHLPRLPPLTPHTLTHHHNYSTSVEHIRCWKCDRDLGEDSRSVQFFCPCDKHVVLPPSNSHTYFEIMDWLEFSLTEHSNCIDISILLNTHTPNTHTQHTHIDIEHTQPR